MDEQNMNSADETVGEGGAAGAHDAGTADIAHGATCDGGTCAMPEADERLEAALKERDENLAGWQRAMADYANLKRESEKGAAEIGKYASAGVVTGLLPVIDSFAKAAEARPSGDAAADAGKLAQWADGIMLIKQQLDTQLAKLGLKAIAETGVPFDASRHEAMMMEPASESAPSGTVTKVLETGYEMNGRVVRAAKVVVAE